MKTFKKIIAILFAVVILGAIGFFALDFIKPKSETIEKDATFPLEDMAKESEKTAVTE